MTHYDDYYFVKKYLDFEGKNGQDFKKSILDIHGGLYWSQLQDLEDYEDEYYSSCAQQLKLGLYEPKQRSRDVSTNHGQTSNRISVPEILLDF